MWLEVMLMSKLKLEYKDTLMSNFGFLVHEESLTLTLISTLNVKLTYPLLPI